MIVNKSIKLKQLQTELAAAGITVAGLGLTGDNLHTYDGDGVPCELPDGAAVVVAAHDPTPVPVVDPDAELEAAIGAATTLNELKAALLGNVRAGKVKAQPRA